MNESSQDDLPRMQNKGDPLSASPTRPMMSDEPSQINSRNMENPLLDGPNTPYSMNNLLNESGDSTMMPGESSIQRNDLNVMIGHPDMMKVQDYLEDTQDGPASKHSKRTPFQGQPTSKDYLQKIKK